MSTRINCWAPSRRLSSGLLLAALLLVAGCAATAPIEPALESEAVPVSFADLAANPSEYLDQTVILGGLIIETVPMDRGTRLTVLETRTEDGERPQGPDSSEGRFIAVAKGFLDPQIYSPGRQVTVAGRVAGQQTEKLGTMDYNYPVIEAQQVYLWPPPEPRYYYPYGYYYPYYGPWEPFFPGPVFVVPREQRRHEERREMRREELKRGREFRERMPPRGRMEPRGGMEHPRGRR